MITLQSPDGRFFALTAENERRVKDKLLKLYKPSERFKIALDGLLIDECCLGDIFNTDKSHIPA